MQHLLIHSDKPFSPRLGQYNSIHHSDASTSLELDHHNPIAHCLYNHENVPVEFFILLGQTSYCSHQGIYQQLSTFTFLSMPNQDTLYGMKIR